VEAQQVQQQQGKQQEQPKAEQDKAEAEGRRQAAEARKMGIPTQLMGRIDGEARKLREEHGQKQQQQREQDKAKIEQIKAEAEARRAQRRAEAEMERRQREEDRREIRQKEAEMAQQQKNQQQQQQQQAAANANANNNMGTIELRANNFDASVRDGSAWLVEFYAPWCGHCKRFAPTYEKVAETLHAQSRADLAKDPGARAVRVAKVDGSADRALASRFNIRGYPTFFLVDGWDVYEYEGDRTLEDLVDFATEDYLDYDPIPFLNSPFGPMGQLRAFFILAGSAAVSSFNWMVKERGFSEVVAAMIMMGVAISIGLFLIIFIGLMSVAKPKTD
jgi:protein disulfide-isomerase-like protein